MRILVDLDDVLVDFVGAAVKLHKRSMAELNEKRIPGTWDISKPLGLSPTEFWYPINHVAGSSFWSNLEKLPWYNELLEAVKAKTNDWYIVTTPSLHLSSYAGKLAWFVSTFGSSFNQYVLTQHKHLLANEQTILIDDSDRNIKKFCDAGGIGLLFPTAGNSKHLLKEKAIDHTLNALSLF